MPQKVSIASRFSEREGNDDEQEEEGQGSTYASRNLQTYVQPNNVSLSNMTVEPLPKVEHYENSVDGQARPGILTVINPSGFGKPRKTETATDIDQENEPVLKGKVIKFGWLEGVLMRCLLNIWGVMLFLRLSWLVGQAGIWEGFLLITLANVVTVITAVSMSAVSTNGKIKGGGIYYLISRALGPEFGGAIGLMFTLANSIAVALYIVGFCESLNDLLEEYDVFILGGSINSIRVVGIGVLIAILILAFVGMDWVTRTQMLLLVILIAAQVDYVVGTIIGPVDNEERAQGFTGFSGTTWNDNWDNKYRVEKDMGQQDFFSVFGVFFPAVTGIVAGANLSGDLKDPAAAIPKGTLLAIFITYMSYIGYALMMGGSVLREATGDLEQYENGLLNETLYNPEIGSYRQCWNETQYECEYGLLNNPQVMALASSWDMLIYFGCFAATLSSAIASLVGAPRVLQALAKDKLYPFIHIFAKGYGANNDPVRGYLLVFCIALGCVVIGKLNALAPLQSNFFLAAYCLINFSVFHASFTKTPGWRPSFKYYNAWVSLLGSVLCIAVMFLMSWVTALITVAVSLFLYMYVSYRAPKVNWGSSTQAQSYSTALSSLLTLNQVEDHVKNYRPQILVLSGMPSARPALIDLSYMIVKDLSLLICGHVVEGHLNHRARQQLTTQANDFLLKHDRKGFYSVMDEKSFDEGAQSLIKLSGLGRLKPNLVMMGYKQSWRTSSPAEIKSYVHVIQEALSMHLAVSILRVPGGLDYSHVLCDEGHMTVEEILEMAKPTTEAPKLGLQRQFSEDLSDSDSESTSSKQKNEDKKKEEDTVKTNSNKPKRKTSAEERFTGIGGAEVPANILESVTQFRQKQKKGNIDVWWLYDDGGLTVLLPYILSTRQKFSDCHLRIFTLASGLDQLGHAQKSIAALLAKFRIDYSDLIVITDVTAKAKPETKKEFEAIIQPFKDEDCEDGTAITSAELVTQLQRTNRNLRLHELLMEHSKDSTFVVMTLPVPRRGVASGPLYMAWLEMITKDLPPFLLVRGNHTSVLTFYS